MASGGCNYRSELDVYGVVEADLLLQILQLLGVLAAAGLHHVFKVKHSRLPSVQSDDRAEVRESEGGDEADRIVGESSGKCQKGTIPEPSERKQSR